MAKRRNVDRLTELEELFADLSLVPRFAAGFRHAFRPQVDCFRSEDPAELTVIVELPGADPDAIQIVATGRTLVVAGTRPRPRCEGQSYYRSEIEYGPFQRELELSEDVYVDSARASYDGGLLKIVFPIAERPPEPVKVPIKVAKKR